MTEARFRNRGEWNGKIPHRDEAVFCGEDRAGLYRRLGFAEINSEVVVEQPHGHVVAPDRTMWLALQPDSTWPDGAVVLQSWPF